MGYGERGFGFSLNFAKKSVRQMHIYGIFSNISNVKVRFFKCKCMSFSFDSWFPRRSRDVYMGSLARSVQEFWLIKDFPPAEMITEP